MQKADMNDTRNIYMSPEHTDAMLVQNIQQPYNRNVKTGEGMRAKLPRLSASEAVNNFDEFYSERNGNNPKYRNIS